MKTNGAAAPIRERRRDEAARWPVIAAGGCVVGFFATLVLASLVTLERVKAAYLAAPEGFSVQRALGLLRPVDGAIALAALAMIGAAGTLEWRRRALRRLSAGESPVMLFVATAAAVLWCAHAQMAPGLIVVGDAGSHIARISHLAMALRDGSSLYWDNYFFAGGTLLQFTGPVFHWLGALAALLTGSATSGAKVVVVGGRFAAAWFMYLWLRRLGLGRSAAALGCLFYAGSFFFTYLVSIRGTLPQIVNIAALPAILACGEGVIAARRIAAPDWPGLVLATTLFIGGHQSTAVIGALLILPYFAWRLHGAGWPRGAVAALVAAGVAAMIAAAFFLVPFLAEKSWTAEDFSAALFAFEVPSLAHETGFLIWGGYGLSAEYTSYLGFCVLLCAAAGALAFGRAARGLAATWLVLIALTVLSQFIVGTYVRMAVLTVLFLSAAAGIGVETLQRRLPGRSWLAMAIVAVFLLDTGASAVQPWDRPDMRAIAREGAAAAALAADARVLEVVGGPQGPRISIGPDSSPLHYARLQMLYGPHKMDATKAHNGMVAVLKLAENDLALDGSFGANALALLAFYDVGWVVGWDEARPGLPAAMPGTLSDPALGRYLRIPDATPVIASGRVTTAETPAALRGFPYWSLHFDDPAPGFEDPRPVVLDLYRRMDVDLAARRAMQILMPAIPPAAGWDVAGAAPVLTGLVHVVLPGAVHLAVTLDRPGYLRIAHPWYPTLDVRVNGAPVVAAPDVFSMLVVPAAAGPNRIDIVAHPAPLRVACFWLTMASLAALVLWLLVAALRSVRRG